MAILIPAPLDLLLAGYSLHQGEPVDGDVDGLFWWCWSARGCDVEVSRDEWATAHEAIASARDALRRERRANPSFPSLLAGGAGALPFPH